MTESPYEPPTAPRDETGVAKHRSFRLTSSASPVDEYVVVGTLQNAIWFSVIQQVPLLLLSGLILDGGMIFKRIAIASIAYWVMTLIILSRRWLNTSDSDILLVKWAFLPILLVVCVFWTVGAALTT